MSLTITGQMWADDPAMPDTHGPRLRLRRDGDRRPGRPRLGPQPPPSTAPPGPRLRAQPDCRSSDRPDVHITPDNEPSGTSYHAARLRGDQAMSSRQPRPSDSHRATTKNPAPPETGQAGPARLLNGSPTPSTRPHA